MRKPGKALSFCRGHGSIRIVSIFVSLLVAASVGLTAAPATAAVGPGQATLHRTGCPAEGAADDQGSVSFTLQGGQITERSGIMDVLGLATQLGAVT